MTKKSSGIGQKMNDVYFEITRQDGTKSIITNKPDNKTSSQDKPKLIG